MSPSRRSRQATRRTIIDMLETTPAQVARPQTNHNGEEQVGDLDFDWRPQPLERVVTSGRSFRWPILGAAIVLGAIAIIAVRGLGTISDSQAQERLTVYREALTAFEASVDELEATLPDIDLDTTLAFSVATEELRLAASEELPGLPPFVPQGSLGDVAAARDQLNGVADVATVVASELDVAASFTSASGQLFAVPPLPTSVPAELVGAASDAITTMQTDTLAALAGLDPDPRFESYISRVEAALDELSDWSDRYLLALGSENADATDALIVEITAQRQLLEAELDVALGIVSESIQARLDEIRTGIEEARVLTASG